ncbi:hypothetical protein TorRG33x02_023000, partial [Trema orientale]
GHVPWTSVMQIWLLWHKRGRLRSKLGEGACTTTASGVSVAGIMTLEYFCEIMNKASHSNCPG